MCHAIQKLTTIRYHMRQMLLCLLNSVTSAFDFLWVTNTGHDYFFHLFFYSENESRNVNRDYYDAYYEPFYGDESDSGSPKWNKSWKRRVHLSFFWFSQIFLPMMRSSGLKYRPMILLHFQDKFYHPFTWKENWARNWIEFKLYSCKRCLAVIIILH